MSVLIVLIALFCVVYGFVKYKLNFWKRKGVPQLIPSIIFGNVGDLFMQKLCAGEMFANLYRRSKALPMLGIYTSLRPVLLINDPELIQTILVKDFEFFNSRGCHVDEKNDPLSGNLFFLSEEKWKFVRTQLSPAFTTMKIKGMFPIIMKCGEDLERYLERYGLAENTLDVLELMRRYTTKIIASIAFGLESDAIHNPNDVFKAMGKRMFAQDLKAGIRSLSSMLTPSLSKFLKMKFVDQELEDFMISLTRNEIESREKNNIVRKDFLQQLIQLRNEGKIGEGWVIKSNEGKSMTINQVAAQAFALFIAGFETTSATIAFCLFELSKNKEIQEKVQEEIDTLGNEITYENLFEMKYLDKCVDETLRKYPAVPFLNRFCTKDYTFPGTDIRIRRGTGIIISMLGLHMDEDYYGKPEEFIPERFDVENFQAKLFAPFGVGPMTCIGNRLGKIMTKLGLVLMLSKYSFELTPETPPELEMDPRIFLLISKNGIKLNIRKRL